MPLGPKRASTGSVRVHSSACTRALGAPAPDLSGPFRRRSAAEPRWRRPCRARTTRLANRDRSDDEREHHENHPGCGLLREPAKLTPDGGVSSGHQLRASAPTIASASTVAFVSSIPRSSARWCATSCAERARPDRGTGFGAASASPTPGASSASSCRDRKELDESMDQTGSLLGRVLLPSHRSPPRQQPSRTTTTTHARAISRPPNPSAPSPRFGLSADSRAAPARGHRAVGSLRGSRRRGLLRELECEVVLLRHRHLPGARERNADDIRNERAARLEHQHRAE